MGRARPSRAFALLVLMAVAAGCGTTKIYTNDPGARVLADGRSLGKGQGELTRRGLPGSTKVVARTDDGREGEVQLKREFTAMTLVMGLFTYGVCLIACWEYPDTVMIPVPMPPGYAPPNMPGYAPPGGAPPPAVDPWLTPPPGWQPAANKNP
jgi:hypothetical protein